MSIIDKISLLWPLVIKPGIVITAVFAVVVFVSVRIWHGRIRVLVWFAVFFVLILSSAIGSVRVYNFLNPEITDANSENYSRYFSDMQDKHIRAAEKYGIPLPISGKLEVATKAKEYRLKRVRSNYYFHIAPLTHSVPYLTENALVILTEIGDNFKDSLDSKGIAQHKIFVTSLLRTDEDVEKLMQKNINAVKNSAHRYATTFDISYTTFIPVGFTIRTNTADLKKVLVDVLRDMCDQKKCYVRYEQKQKCFHITARQ